MKHVIHDIPDKPFLDIHKYEATNTHDFYLVVEGGGIPNMQKMLSEDIRADFEAAEKAFNDKA